MLFCIFSTKIQNLYLSMNCIRFTEIHLNKSLSEIHQKALAQLEKMNDEQVKAVLAFINSLDELEKSLQPAPPDSKK